jgi:hypothetical protein
VRLNLANNLWVSFVSAACVVDYFFDVLPALPKIVIFGQSIRLVSQRMAGA